MKSPSPSDAETAAAIDPLRVWFRFVRLHRRVSAAVGAELRRLGLSIPQFDVLSTLTEREGLAPTPWRDAVASTMPRSA